MATTSYAFVRTRSMTQREAQHVPKAPPKPASGAPIPPTSPARIPLQEALMNLERDGSPRKHTPTFTGGGGGSFEIALPKTPPIQGQAAEEDKENPFLVGSADPSSTVGGTKRKASATDEREDVSMEDSAKRLKVSPPTASPRLQDDEDDDENPATVANEGLGSVQRKIEFLSLKRTRDTSPPPLPSADDENAHPEPDPNVDDVSPRKRPRPSFIGPSTTDPADLPEMPHINLVRPPPSPTRLRQPTSPMKFVGVPQLQKSGLTRSDGRGGLFATAVAGSTDEKDAATGKEKAEEKSRPTFLGKYEPLVLVTSPMASSTPASDIPALAIDPALLALSSPSPAPTSSTLLASPAPYSTPLLPFVSAPREAAASPPPTPLRALSPPGKLPSSRLPVRSTRLRSLASLVQPIALPPHPMQTRAGTSRPPRTARKPPSAFRAPPPAAEASTVDILAPVKDHDHVSRDVGMLGSASRSNLSRSTTISSEAQTSLSNLSVALSKLTLPPPAPRSNSRHSFTAGAGLSTNPAPAQQQQAAATSTIAKPLARRQSTSSALPNSRAPSTQLSVLAASTTGSADASAALGASASGKAREYSHAPLAGCVVFVDVRTKDGEDAGGVFIDMLKALGARVLKSPTPSLTHLVLKSPLPNTLSRYHSLPNPKPEAVAVGWVVKCAEEDRRVEAAAWRLDLTAGAGVMSAIPGCSKRGSAGPSRGNAGPRRATMEPRRIELLDEASLSNIVPPVVGLQEKVERAKRRSLMYQPKFSSPLRGNVLARGNEGEPDGPDPVL